MLFLTFCSEDAEAARALALGLTAAGQKVWCSAVPGTIPIGEWTKALYDELEKSSGYLILIGDASLERRWVDLEIGWALNLRARRGPKFPIVPVLLPTAEAARDVRGAPDPRGSDPLGPGRVRRPAATARLHALPAAVLDAEDGPFPGLEPMQEVGAVRGDEVHRALVLEHAGQLRVGD